MNLLEFSKKPAVRGQTMLIYGPPKSGKTVLAGTLAKRFNITYLDLENSVQSLVTTDKITAAEKERIQVIQVPDNKLNPIAIETTMKILTGNAVKICEKHGKIGCLACMQKPDAVFAEFCAASMTPNDVLIIDSLSQLSDSAFAQVVGPSVDPEKEWKHYDSWNQRLAMCLSLIQYASFNVVFIGHAKMLVQEDGTEKLVPSGGTKAFSTHIPRYFGHVIYTDVRGGQFVTGSKQDFAANIIIGNRSNLKLGVGGIELQHFFLPPSEWPTAQAAPALLKK